MKGTFELALIDAMKTLLHYFITCILFHFFQGPRMVQTPFFRCWSSMACLLCSWPSRRRHCLCTLWQASGFSQTQEDGHRRYGRMFCKVFTVIEMRSIGDTL